MHKFLTNILYSFPVQLLILQIRGNLILPLLWAFLVALLVGWIGQKYGVQVLFLAPEYMGSIGFQSFFILGFAFAVFFMSWNLTTYLLSAHYFPFLASLARPFTKFCLNNSIIPLSFGGFLLILHSRFNEQFTYSTKWDFVWNSLGFIAGIILLLCLASLYFHYTNKDILNFLKARKKLPPNLSQSLAPGRRKVSVEDIKAERTKWRVDTYVTERLRIRPVRSVAHYDIKILMSVFKQNHVNALIIQLISLMTLIGLGLLIDHPYFRIPAGASIFLLGSVIVAFIGAISYWFSRWRMTALFVLALSINFITSKDIFNHKNKAYGLNYQAKPATYTRQNLKKICSIENWNTDYLNTLQILENWKKKVSKGKKEKPKMVLYCVSGGGLKSSVWAMQVLQQADSLTNGKLMAHTMLMSGASGGMIGSAYFRELYLQQQMGQLDNLYSEKYIDNVATDLLNSVAFTIVSNDLFQPWTTFENNNYTYKKDRGYVFEKTLNENFDSLLDKRIQDYRLPEENAQIPMLFLTPSIVNDGRRMIISPQGVSYMMAAPIALEDPDAVDIDAVDFGRLFAEQDAEDLRFLTGLRINATFPYILPNVYLPSSPQIEVVDAGFRDNFGLKSAVRFAHVYKDWILENTSGVVLVQVTGFGRETDVPPSENQGALESIFNPLGIVGQVIDLQFFEHDTNVGLLYDLLGKEHFEILHFTYFPSENAAYEAPISFHLTEREKDDVVRAIDHPRNLQSMERLQELLNGEGGMAGQ